ncbi:hypothetical protein K461DRAFT_308844 [Myriangium duriaei CBS 260.36]|uniref:NmrA-like domain-containing protein n=1 Tax=Myriangium duriaei CBS 260.36 TaxID=1168546 RepID=A0A9P4MJ02_9PEZI|nr:hypothetical protein K461DRAFT_308844 [Myriangium duriaei CBS 260.36]
MPMTIVVFGPTGAQGGNKASSSRRSLGDQLLGFGISERRGFSGKIDYRRSQESGKLPDISHFDGKNEIDRHSGIPISSFVNLGFYPTNIVEFAKKDDDGTLTLALPVTENAKFPLLDPADNIAATGYLHPDQIMSEVERVSKKKARFVSIPAETFKRYLPPENAQELLENMQLLDSPGYYGGEGLEETRKLLDDEPTSWESFIQSKQYGWIEVRSCLLFASPLFAQDPIIMDCPRSSREPPYFSISGDASLIGTCLHSSKRVHEEILLLVFELFTKIEARNKIYSISRTQSCCSISTCSKSPTLRGY